MKNGGKKRGRLRDESHHPKFESLEDEVAELWNISGLLKRQPKCEGSPKIAYSA